MILPLCFMGKFGGRWCLEQNATLRPPGLRPPLGWPGPLCLVSLILSCFQFSCYVECGVFLSGAQPVTESVMELSHGGGLSWG